MEAMIGILLALAGAAVWTVHLRGLRRLGPEPGSPDGDLPSVSIIVPARNEAHNLPALLQSLRRLQPAAAEVIVVDDHSTDGTASVAAAGGARVVGAPPLPPGWMGKPWACRAGAGVARGEYLLFTDADTVHGPDSLALALGHARRTGADLVSVVPTHIVRAAWEHLQGIFQLLLLVATGATRPGRGERRYSIGQYLLFRRDLYDHLGGHEVARDRIAEDLALARAVEEAGGRFALLHSPGLLRVRMYPEGFAGFVRGWRRSFREGMAAAGIAGVAEITLVMAWLLGVPLALAGAAAAGAATATLGWSLAYAATAVEIGRRQRQLGRFSAVGAALYPGFCVIFVLISVLAVLDRAFGAPVRWKSRALPARSSRS
jgi:4,4'-diaponeurosporenoate glycosyltransferase